MSELQISELHVSEFLSSEFLVSEFLRSGAPTSQPTIMIVEEAVELADTTKTVVSEFLSSGVVAFLVSELCVPGFRSSWPRIFGVPSFGALQFSELQISELPISELQVLELLSSEFLVLEFLRSGAPTSQLTILIVQEAVELADTIRTVASDQEFWFSWIQSWASRMLVVESPRPLMFPELPLNFPLIFLKFP